MDPLGLADVTILPKRFDEEPPKGEAEQKMIQYWQEEQQRRIGNKAWNEIHKEEIKAKPKLRRNDRDLILIYAKNIKDAKTKLDTVGEELENNNDAVDILTFQGHSAKGKTRIGSQDHDNRGSEFADTFEEFVDLLMDVKFNKGTGEIDFIGCSFAPKDYYYHEEKYLDKTGELTGTRGGVTTRGYHYSYVNEMQINLYLFTGVPVGGFTKNSQKYYNTDNNVFHTNPGRWVLYKGGDIELEKSYSEYKNSGPINREKRRRQ